MNRVSPRPERPPVPTLMPRSEASPAATAARPARGEVAVAGWPPIGARFGSSAEVYRALVDHSGDAVLLTAPDGRILAANPAACRLFRGTEAEMCAAGRAALVDPADPRVTAFLAERTRERRARGELTHRRLDGTTFPGEVSSVLFRDHDGEARATTTIRDLTDRKRAELALRESEERFRSAFEHAGIGMALVATTGRFLRVNRSFCAFLGLAETDLLATDFQSITHPDDLDRDLALRDRLVAGAITDYRMEKRYRHRDGRFVWGLLSASLVRDERGRPVHFISQIQDIDERKRAEVALRESEARLRDFFDHAGDLVVSVDERGRFVYVNQAWRDALGYGPAEAARLTFWQTVHPDERERCRDAWRRLRAGEAVGEVESVFVTRAGHPLPVAGRVIGRAAGPGFVAQGIFRDVTARRAREARLAHQATHDALTGLPNRALFLERLAAAARPAARQRRPLTVLYVDLDGFKAVNDRLGHAGGDALLVVAARRLTGCVRAGDTVARLGGDEFAILLEPGGDPELGKRVAARAIATLGEPVAVGDGEVRVAASVGVAADTPADDTGATLLHAADQAMYRAKRAGSGRLARGTKAAGDVPVDPAGDDVGADLGDDVAPATPAGPGLPASGSLNDPTGPAGAAAPPHGYGDRNAVRGRPPSTGSSKTEVP